MTHPLTDAICEELADTEDRPFTDIEMDNMRAAYDLGRDAQLEQVIEWMEVNLMKHDFYEGYAYLYDDCSQAYIREEELLEDLREAMRPTTTTQENNND